MSAPRPRSDLGPGSRLLRWRRIVERNIEFLGGGLYFLVVQRLVTGMWLGYGERPGRVLFIAILVLLVTWLLYWQLGTFVLDPGGQVGTFVLEPGGHQGNFAVDPDATSPAFGHPSWRNALYYSLASFASLGYGGWVATPLGWARWVGAIESFLGIFSAVFFSVTLGQRIAR